LMTVFIAEVGILPKCKMWLKF